jgi:hypothetical protein
MLREASMIETGQVLAAQLAVFQALLLAASAVHKASTWSRSLGVMRQFGGVPSSLARAALGTVIASEFVAALLLLVPAHRAAGAILAAALWTVYLALMLRAILQNRRDLDCGCSFGLPAGPITSVGHLPAAAKRRARRHRGRHRGRIDGRRAACRWNCRRCWAASRCWPCMVHWIK